MKESTTAHQPLSRRAFLAKLAIVSPVACLALCAREAQADTNLSIRVGNPSNVHGARGTKRTVRLCIKIAGKSTVTDADLHPCIVHCFTDCANHPDHFDGKMMISKIRAHCECCNNTHDMWEFVYTINSDPSFDDVNMYVKLPTIPLNNSMPNNGTGISKSIHVPIGY